MSNGNGHDEEGAGGVRVHPQEVARAALMFLSRADFKRHERQAFDLAEAMLNAIAEGTVTLTPSQSAAVVPGGSPTVEPASH